MPAIDPRVLDDLRALQTPGTPSVLGEMIDLFLQETDATVEKLRRSLADRDLKACDRTALSLKGNAGNLGAQALARVCVDLQNLVRASDWTRAAGLLPTLESAVRAAREELLEVRR